MKICQPISLGIRGESLLVLRLPVEDDLGNHSSNSLDRGLEDIKILKETRRRPNNQSSNTLDTPLGNHFSNTQDSGTICGKTEGVSW